MNNCLVLLTNYYPFYKGEEYLESEIYHLAKRFNKIFVISTMVNDNMPQTREVPSNVIVLPVGISHSKVGKVKMVMNQIKDIKNDDNKKIMIKKDSHNKIINKLYCYYFESRAMDVYQRVEEILNNYDFDNYSSVTIYSYWLYITARVGVELKNNYFVNKNTYMISRAHRYDLYEDAAPLKYLPQRDFLLNQIDMIYPCSQDGVNALYKTYPLYKDKVEVRRLGTINKNISAKNCNDKLYIVSCSAVRKVKRLDLLIESLVELEKQDIPFLWTHIGGGKDLDKIKKLASQKLEKDKFEFLGHIKNEDVLRWYSKNNATVFVNLSSSEGVPVSIMEALSMRLPIVATDAGGTREIVEDGYNGYILPIQCTPEQVSKRLIEIFKLNKDEYDSMCNNALDIWNDRCDANVLYDNFANELSCKM